MKESAAMKEPAAEVKNETSLQASCGRVLPHIRSPLLTYFTTN